MQIIGQSPFTCGPVDAKPGDSIVGTFTNTYSVNGRTVKTEVFRIEAQIKTAGTYDHSVLVKFTPEEAAELGLESAYGTFVGKAINGNS
jgi:hypothetical protein